MLFQGLLTNCEIKKVKKNAQIPCTHLTFPNRCLSLLSKTLNII
jgi:hypothetical protein